MAMYYYNGVLLPEIPSDALSECPYCIMFETDVAYALYLFQYQPLAITGGTTASFSNEDGVDMKVMTYGYLKDENSDAFVFAEEKTTQSVDIPLDQIKIHWSNTDIYQLSAGNKELYFSASEPVPYEEKYYLIKESTLKSIGNSIRGKTGETELIPPENMPSTIDGISGGGAELNIAYGDTAPEDTSKLWVKCAEPSNVLVSPETLGETTIAKLTTATLNSYHGIGTAVVGTKIYLFGGASNMNPKNNIWVFDTETETITTLSVTLPYAMWAVGTAVVGTKVYLFGGASQYAQTVYSYIQVFDTETETLTTLSTSLETNVYYVKTAVIDGKIYILGGRNNKPSYFYNIRVFDPENETLTTLSVNLSVSCYMATAVVGTKIYLFGGYANGNKDTISVFDTEAGTITTLDTTLPIAVRELEAVTVGNNIYIFGGYSNNVKNNAIYIFDTQSKTLETLNITLITARQDFGIAVVGTKVYLFGGYYDESSIERFWIQMNLVENNLQIQPSLTKNLFNLISGDTTIYQGVENVFKGNSEGYAEKVEACLYKDGEWTAI